MVDNGRVLSEIYATKAVAWLAVLWASDGEGALILVAKIVATIGMLVSLYRAWTYEL